MRSSALEIQGWTPP